MESSRGIRLGSVAGTPLYVEGSFLILAAFFVAMNLEGGTPVERALLWIPTLFFSVLFHEIGHAVTIAALGHGSSLILLTGFGGVTLNQRTGKPWQELVISLAGPLFSFLLAVLSFLLFRSVPFANTDPMMSVWLPMLIQANIFWGVFNLVPIHPMDGGHVLRNFALLFLSPSRSFVLSVWVSILAAALIGVYGLITGSFIMAIMALFLLMQNYQRWSAYRQGGTLED